jgi:hypothetical protein
MRDLQKMLGDMIANRENNRSEFETTLKSCGRLSLQDAIRVYQNGYEARLTEALGEIFEGVWWVLGDQKFFEVCRHYIRGHESKSYNLSDYGFDFSSFLQSNEPPAPLAPFLPDLARYEWLFHETFHEAQASHFDHAELHLLHQHANVILGFQNNIRLFSSPYTVYPIWKMRGETADNVGPLAWDMPEHLFIYKQAQSVFVQHLSPSGFHVLDLMVQGQTLEQAIDKTAMLFGDLSEEQVSQLFGDLIKAGVIKSIRGAT